MTDKVKLSKDGSSIDFVQSESLPTSLKKFRQSPEIEGFYRFVFENDLQKETYEILDRIIAARKAKKSKDRKDAKAAQQAAQASLEEPKIKASPVKTAKPVADKKIELKEIKKTTPVQAKAANKSSAKPAHPAKNGKSKSSNSKNKNLKK